MGKDEKYIVIIKDFNGWNGEEERARIVLEVKGTMCSSTSIFMWNSPDKCPYVQSLF